MLLCLNRWIHSLSLAPAGVRQLGRDCRQRIFGLDWSRTDSALTSRNSPTTRIAIIKYALLLQQVNRNSIPLFPISVCHLGRDCRQWILGLEWSRTDSVSTSTELSTNRIAIVNYALLLQQVKIYTSNITTFHDHHRTQAQAPTPYATLVWLLSKATEYLSSSCAFLISC